MAFLADTSAAIVIRDSDNIGDALKALSPPVFLSAISRIELENGVYRSPALTAVRRKSLDLMLRNLPTMYFGEDEIAAYRSIVAAIGYSRRNTLDRMIAATALVHDLTLVTTNGADFRDIPGLKLDVWPSPPS